jgi:sortase A
MDSTELEALRRNNRVNRILDLTGKTLISAGLLLLLFVAYQLWGTGLAERQAQDKLQSQFVTTTTQPTTTPTNVPTTTLAPVTPKKGDVVAQILIDSIKVNKFVIAGVGYKELEKGPGLFTGSPLPGQFGNVAIAGHRTTYGAPFSRLDELKTGDRIVMKTSQASYTYIVSNAPKIVKATDVDVIRTVDKTRATLTLVTCHPKWTSENRLIISAELEPKIVAQTATLFVADDKETEEVLTDGWLHDPSALPIVIVYALFLALIAIVANQLARKKWRGVIVYPVAAVVFLPTLFVFFSYLTRLLPTNL